MSNVIKVQKNIYKFLLYALEELRETSIREIDEEECISLNDMYALMLNTNMQYVLNSGILQEYNKITQYSDRPRGILDIPTSIMDGQYQKGQLNCTYFKLDIDTGVNRTIKVAILILLQRHKSISKKNVSKLRIILSNLNKVKDILPDEIDYANIDTNNLSIEYKSAFIIAKNVIEEFMTRENGKDKRLIDTEDIERLHIIFEKFIRNFCKIHYKGMASYIGRRHLSVKQTAGTIYNKGITDVTIENKKKNRVLIIDAKWHGKILYEHGKISTANQNQIEGYVNDYWDDFGKDGMYIVGILVHAWRNKKENIEEIEKYKKELGRPRHGMICTKVIDIEKEFSEIEEKVRSIVEEYVL